ncbi:MAG: AI-2E family transporter, partial [Meiothermus ruber]|nr:AI-2E family transporter [Meiothermus ruber]
LGLASFLIAEMVNVLARYVTELPRILTPLLTWIENLPSRIGQVELPPALEGAFAQAAQGLQTLLEGFTQTLLQGLRALLAQGGSLV